MVQNNRTLDWIPPLQADRQLGDMFYQLRYHPEIRRSLQAGRSFKKLLQPVMWDDPLTLDQGQEGECVGYGWTGLLACQPYHLRVDDATAEAIYEKAQAVGGQLPDEQSGSSVLNGAKAAQALGYIKSYYWAQNPQQVAVALSQGPVVVGIDWHQSMFTPDKNGVLTVAGSVAGGHCVCLHGYDPKVEMFTLRNSWGSGWGVNGDATISMGEFVKVWGGNSEAATVII